MLGFDQMTTEKFVTEAGGCKNMGGMVFRTGILGEKSKNPALHDFVKRWKAAHSKVDPFLPMIQYAGLEVVFEALRRAGDDLGHESIRDAFRQIQGFESIFGRINVQQNGETMNIVHIMKLNDDCKQEIVKENY